MMKRHKILIALFLCGLFLLSSCHPKAKVEEKKVPRAYICHQTIGRIKIDGILDEPDWQRASSLPFFHLTKEELQTHFPAESPASGKLLWDDNNLYLVIEARDKDIWATIREHDGRLWQEDVLEAFFKPERNKPSYYEFEFSPKNVSLDLMIPRRGARSFEYMKSFESNLKSAVKVYGSLDNWHDRDDKWILEVAIPFSAFKEVTPSPKLEDRWSFALCRYDYSVYLKEGVELSSTAKLSAMNFHLWEDYDILLFQK